MQQQLRAKQRRAIQPGDQHVDCDEHYECAVCSTEPQGVLDRVGDDRVGRDG